MEQRPRRGRYPDSTSREAAVRASKRAYYHRNKESERAKSLARYYKTRSSLPLNSDATPAQCSDSTKRSPNAEKQSSNGSVDHPVFPHTIDAKTNVAAVQQALRKALGIQKGSDDEEKYAARSREVIELVMKEGWSVYREVLRARCEHFDLLHRHALALFEEVNRRCRETFEECDALCKEAGRLACCEEEIALLMEQGLDAYKEAYESGKLVWQTT